MFHNHASPDPASGAHVVGWRRRAHSDDAAAVNPVTLQLLAGDAGLTSRGEADARLGRDLRREPVRPSATPTRATQAMTATTKPMMLSSKMPPVPSRFATSPPITEPTRPSSSVATTLRFCLPGFTSRAKSADHEPGDDESDYL